MSQKLIRGRAMVCDRCGNKEFLTEGQLDKGNHFWSRITLPDEEGRRCLYDLCPICNSVYETMTRRFMDAVTKKCDDCSDCDWDGYCNPLREAGDTILKGFEDGLKKRNKSCEGMGTDE